jgi:hypothetical protein
VCFSQGIGLLPDPRGAYHEREGNRTPKGLPFLGSLRSVDYWPLAKIFTRFLGVSCDQYPLVSLTGVTGFQHPPLEECILQC